MRASGQLVGQLGLVLQIGLEVGNGFGLENLVRDQPGVLHEVDDGLFDLGLSRFEVAIVLADGDLVGFLGLDHVGSGLVDGDLLRLELLDQAGIVEFDDAVWPSDQ